MAADQTTPPACPTCWRLLSEGLDICARGRRMDEADRRNSALAASDDPEAWVASGRFDTFVARQNTRYPHAQIATRSGTVALWVQEQYERDLAAWEAKTRAHLPQCRGGEVVA